MIKYFVIFIYTIFLTGCAVHTPSGSAVVNPKPAAKPAAKPSGNEGGFCPPGQAKKGNC
jgi:hypothetical protein